MSSPAPQVQWYYSLADQQLGPVSAAELHERIADGVIGPNDLVWHAGLPQWTSAAQAGLVRAPAGPPPLPPGAPAYGGGPSLGYATHVGAMPDPNAPPPEKSWLIPTGRSGWAIAAGYLGLFSFLPIFAPFALVVSIMALRDIKRHPGLGGMGRAIFGLVMGVLGTAALCFFTVISIGSIR